MWPCVRRTLVVRHLSHLPGSVTGDLWSCNCSGLPQWPAVLSSGEGCLCSLGIAHNDSFALISNLEGVGTAIRGHCKQSQVYTKGLNRKSEDPATGVYSHLFNRCSHWEVGRGGAFQWPRMGLPPPGSPRLEPQAGRGHCSNTSA